MHVPGTPSESTSPTADSIGAQPPVAQEPVTAVQAPAPAVEGEGEAAPSQPKEDRFSAKFAAIAREEKKMRLEREKFKAEREAERAALAKEKEEVARHRELKSKLKSDRGLALKYLEEGGLTYDDLTQLILNDNKPTPEMMAKQVREEMEAFKREQEEAKRRAEEEAQKKQAEQLQSVLDNFKNEITTFVDQNAETYELTKTHPEGVELIFNVIDQHHAQTGRILSTEEAAKYVEAYLEEEAEKLYRGTKKLQAKIGGAPAPKTDPEVAPKATPAQAAATQTPKTLTNTQQATVAAPVERELSPDESKALAAKMLRWT